MKRLGLLVSVALAGVVLGAITVISIQAPAAPADPTPAPTVAVTPAPLPETGPGVLLVWSAGALPDGLAAAVGAVPGVADVTVVAGGGVDLIESRGPDGAVVEAWQDGWVVPLDALAVDPAGFAAYLPAASAIAFRDLDPGEAVLGATSARLRGVGVGGVLSLASGHELTVAAIVDDVDVAGAELVVARAAAPELGIATNRFALLTYAGERAAIEAAIRAAVPATMLRVRAPGETPFLRHGDAVLPQALIKDRFGEFSYRPPPPGERDFAPDAAFEAANIVTVAVPILGTVRCHRGIVDALSGALDEIVASGLASLVDPDAFAGCHNPRLTVPGGSVSHHAWGVAFDLNYADNPTGLSSVQDPRLVETLARWGFTWGGFWLVPDPAHFEYRAPPDLVAVKAAKGE